MIIPRPQDAIHKAWLYRLLTTIADDPDLISKIYFKGGTCAAMLGYLDRFSVDLDFAAGPLTQKSIMIIREKFVQHFMELGLTVKQFSKVGIQYICRYPSNQQQRSTIKVEVQFPAPPQNRYQATYFGEIDRTLPAETIETMFANKLLAVFGRWEKHKTIAGRDIYDIHYFFLQGYRYDPAIIQERRGTTVPTFFQELIDFIDQRISQTQLQQDLNVLLPYDKFKKLYPTLKQETVMLLRDELARLQN